MDKRRFVSRDPNTSRVPKSIADDESGNPALDGYVVRDRKPLKRKPWPYSYGERDTYVAGSLMDEDEVRYGEIYKD